MVPNPVKVTQAFFPGRLDMIVVKVWESQGRKAVLIGDARPGSWKRKPKASPTHFLPASALS